MWYPGVSMSVQHVVAALVQTGEHRQQLHPGRDIPYTQDTRTTADKLKALDLPGVPKVKSAYMEGPEGFKKLPTSIKFLLCPL